MLTRTNAIWNGDLNHILIKISCDQGNNHQDLIDRRPSTHVRCSIEYSQTALKNNFELSIECDIQNLDRHACTRNTPGVILALARSRLRLHPLHIPSLPFPNLPHHPSYSACADEVKQLRQMQELRHSKFSLSNSCLAWLKIT